MPRIRETLKYSFNRELTYNLTRPYPFGKPFKILVVLGFLSLLCLVVLFSVANSAYDLQPIYVTSPNETERQPYWFNAWPFAFGDEKLKPKCEPFDMPIGHEFMTSNFGLRYTVDRVTSNHNKSAHIGLHPSLPYRDHILTNCEVVSVDIYLDKSDQSAPGSWWYSWAASHANAHARCEVPRDEVTYTVFFSTRYSGLNEQYRYLAVDDPKNSTSLWWGARLLNNYFIGVQALIAGKLTVNGSTWPAISQAQLSYLSGTVDEMKAHNLFKVWYYFLFWDGSIANPSNVKLDTSRLYNNISFTYSRPMTEGFFFAKVLRSMILTDLGDNRTSNLLVNEDRLRYALAPDDNFNRVTDGPLNNATLFDAWKIRGISPPNATTKTFSTVKDMRLAYDLFKNDTGPLGTKPARIYAQYVCSVPVRKGTATTLLFTLVAVLSLMQTAWLVFKWIAEVVVEMQDPSGAMICEGCRAKGSGDSTSRLVEDSELGDEQDVEMRSWETRAYQPVDGQGLG